MKWILVFLFGMNNLAAQSKAMAVLSAGQKAPKFSLKILDGERVFLSDYCGNSEASMNTPRKNVLLSFWASWCAPCKKEIPELHEVVKKYSTSDLAVFLVNVGDNEETVSSVLKENHYTLPILMDTYGNAAGKYCPKTGELVSLPTIVLIDKDGIVRYINTGYDDAGLVSLEQQIKSLTN